MRKLLLIIAGLLIGIFIYQYINNPKLIISTLESPSNLLVKRQKIGFIPYWLLKKQKTESLNKLTTLTYFGVTINNEGKIQKIANEVETEPDWLTLKSKSLQNILQSGKNRNQTLSLLVFNGISESIDQLIAKPEKHGKEMVKQLVPVMKKYGFTDLNLDLENVNLASRSAQLNFAKLVKTIDQELNTSYPKATITLEMMAMDFIKKDLIDPKLIKDFVDYVVIMTYDYHFAGSLVTGPVAPLNGAGNIFEYDVNSAIDKALEIFPAKKIILGIPLYGYEWETLSLATQSATLPSSGLAASHERVSELLEECNNCQTGYDSIAKEGYLSYEDEETDTFHQIYYPTQQAINEKLKFAKQKHLGGVAFWAMGYEKDSELLKPLNNY